MDTRQRDIFVFLLVNISIPAWTFWFAYDKGPKVFLIVFLASLIAVNLSLWSGVWLRKRRERKQASVLGSLRP